MNVTMWFCGYVIESPEILNLLIERGANVNQRDHDGWTPLMCCVNTNHKQFARILLEHGADVNAKSRKGETALSLAQEKDDPDPDMVALLKKVGAKN